MPLKKLLDKAGKKARSPKKQPRRTLYTNKLSYEDLINAESELGRTLFGPVPAGYRREFFRHKPNVWIWHESYVDMNGVEHGMTIRYEVRPTGVYKKPLNGHYEKLSGVELNNFRMAARGYLELVKTKLYC